MKVIQKASVILLLVVLLMSCCASVTAHAAALDGFDSTNVLDDLKGSTIAGEKFNLDDYTYTDERELKVLNFAEYGFGVKDSSHYGLYVYVYNPTGKPIQNVSSNKVTVATIYNSKGVATDYEKFELQLLSVSDGKYAYLFYKFKLKNVAPLLTRVQASPNKRRYDVSEIELRFDGSNSSDAFEVANYWEYSGYAKGLGADSEAASTLACESLGIDVLKLDVKSTYYRYNNGVATQSNMSSVYFGVPNKIFEKYGKLQQIKANWFETKTQRMIILSDKKLANALYEYVGVNTQNATINLAQLDNDAGHVYQWLYGDPKIPIGGSLIDPTYQYAFGFDGRYHEKSYEKNALDGNYYNFSNQLDWVLYSKTETVSADKLLEYAKNYTAKVGGNLLIDKYSSALFVAGADANRKYGWQGADGKGEVFDADALFDIKGFKTGSKLAEWWAKKHYKDLEGSPLEDIEPIYIVQPDDVVTSSEIADRLYVADEDVGVFSSVYRQNALQNKQTVLFRFAVTNYTVDKLHGYRSLVTSDDIGYWAQETMFLDFDIIWLKFVTDKGVATVIPTVSNPVDVASGTTPPLEETPLFPGLSGGANIWDKIVAFIKKYWWILPVGAIGVGLVVVVAQFGLTAVLKGLWWLISAPFKALAKLFKKDG